MLASHMDDNPLIPGVTILLRVLPHSNVSSVTNHNFLNLDSTIYPYIKTEILLLDLFSQCY